MKASARALYSIPVLEESYILAYRKDIFDQYNIKVPTTNENGRGRTAGREKAPAFPVSSLAARRRGSLGTGYMSGIKSYTDGQWSEFDKDLHALRHDPRAVKFTEMWIDMIRESGPPTGPACNGMTRWRRLHAGQAGMIADAVSPACQL